jgi:hypothetical protein
MCCPYNCDGDGGECKRVANDIAQADFGHSAFFDMGELVYLAEDHGPRVVCPVMSQRTIEASVQRSVRYY